MTKSDLYPGLDAKLDAILERNIASGIATPPEQVAVSGLEAVVEEKLQQKGADIKQPETLRVEDLREWALPDLTKASSSWNNYYNALGRPELMPDSSEVVEKLGFSNPNFYPTLERLYRAQHELIKSGETTPEGLNIGETMHLTLVPWQEMRDELDNLQSWVKQLRGSQAATSKEDYINEHLLAAIREDRPLYRDPDNPTIILKPSDYLDKRIAQDGPWGIMLVQTSEQAGLESILGKSPDDLTSEGVAHYQIADTMGSGETCSVDALGIFEWLALSFQEDPSQLSAKDFSWLLANRLEVNGTTCVPYGFWDNDQVRSSLIKADYDIGYVRPRLAVL